MNETATVGLTVWALYPMGVQPITEAYLQQELRRLHYAVEQALAAPGSPTLREALEATREDFERDARTIEACTHANRIDARKVGVALDAAQRVVIYARATADLLAADPCMRAGKHVCGPQGAGE